MKNLAFIFIILLVTTSCRQLKMLTPGTTTNNESILQETVRDTIILFTADSSYFRAFLECDSANQIIMRELENIQGKKVRQDIVYRNKILTVQAKIDSQAVYIALKDRYQKSTDKEVVVQQVVKKIYPKWMVILSLIGSLAIGYLLFKVGMKVKKLLTLV